jgi:hypothetical protein
MLLEMAVLTEPLHSQSIRIFFMMAMEIPGLGKFSASLASGWLLNPLSPNRHIYGGSCRFPRLLLFRI